MNRFMNLIKQNPQAAAKINGSADYPDIKGNVYFYETNMGALVVSEITGLPYAPGECTGRIFAYHIHSGISCTGNENDPFADAMTHYNPHGCPHPYHAGDMPPLFGCKGYAFSAFVTNRFKVRDIIGKTVIIHSDPDDFTTQPSGNAGQKLACGVVEVYRIKK